MSYRMLLNLLILFLCTGCCACGDYCQEPIETFYIRLIDAETGENFLEKSDSIQGVSYLTDEFDNQITARVLESAWYESNSPYLVVAISYDENDIYKLWVKDNFIGTFTLDTKKAKRNITACCFYNKVQELEFQETDIILTSKPEEKNQPFYEIQF